MRSRSSKKFEPTVATHFPSLSRKNMLNQNVHMFTEDVHLAVMPIGGKSVKHKEFSVSFVGSDDERRKAELLIGEICRYNRRDMRGMVSDAIEELARHLAWEGRAVYEIISDNEGSQHVCAFTSKGLWRLPGCFMQVIPRGDWDFWMKKVVFVPTSKVWCLEMPLALGGRSAYRSILRELRRFEHLGPKFWSKDLERGTQSKNFDFQRYVRNSEIYYGQVTKKWGWNRRDWSQERCTEFFTIYKKMRFLWAQAILREHIINELNSLFKRLDIKCQLEVNGLPTSDDICQENTKLLKGEITFSAALGLVRL